MDVFSVCSRDGRLLKEYQHPSYRGRVELNDPEMRNRDVSVVLRNVSNSDAGTYECLVSIKSEQTSRQYVRLTVTDEGHKGDAPAGNKRARIGKVKNTAGGGNKNGYVGLALCVVSALVL
ncbi:uncharacterized protein LOC126404382 isoform X2 [Epinephelus moara]|uniref:uncharacterized protein LOC126404382 isoform X2 n=1 Tax=Epinephelus moara TaxID=300413 RepID=UPI00214F495B|nr:uncharacterized protein LOC126404382 isoform X2 [Epinephelus moara]